MDAPMDLSCLVELHINFKVYHAIFNGPANTSRFYEALNRFMQYHFRITKPHRMTYFKNRFVIQWYVHNLLRFSPVKVEQLRMDLHKFVVWWLIQHAHDCARNVPDSLIRRSVSVCQAVSVLSEILEMVVDTL